MTTGTRSMEVAPLVGRGVELRALRMSDYEWLYEMYTSQAAFRWRFRGSTPDPGEFVELLWAGVLAQYVVVAPETGALVGLVVAHGAHPAQHVQTSVVGGEHGGEGEVLVRGWLLLANYLFTHWPFRKLYRELLAPDLAPMASGEGRYFDVEARLLDHDFNGDGFVERVTIATYRHHWEDSIRRLVPLV